VCWRRSRPARANFASLRKRNLEILCRSCNTCAHIFLLGRRARETLVGMHAQAQAFRRPPPSARTHLSSQSSRCTPRAVEVPGAFGNALQRAPSPLLRTLHQSKGASEKMRRADRESGGFRILCPRPVNHSQICFCNFGTLPDSIGPRVSHCLQDEWYRLFGGEAVGHGRVERYRQILRGEGTTLSNLSSHSLLASGAQRAKVFSALWGEHLRTRISLA
jgi:hypothetical protein